MNTNISEAAKHKKERRDKLFLVKKEREANGLCVICGREPKLSDVRYGIRCKEKMDRARLAKTKWNRLNAENLAIRGLCSMCGKNSAIEGYKRCLECKEKAREGQYRRRIKRLEKGLCYRCGQRPIAQDSICACTTCLRTEYLKTKTKDIRERNKDLCFEAYGGAVCACCGETTRKFLTFDHVNNDGAEHRKKDPSAGNLVNWLKMNGFPSGFQVLCYNCNYGKKVNGGICPHKDLQ